MLVHRRVTPSIKFAGTHLHTWVERDTVRVKCLAQEHNTKSPARARTRTARSRDECTNHEATAPLLTVTVVKSCSEAEWIVVKWAPTNSLCVLAVCLSTGDEKNLWQEPEKQPAIRRVTRCCWVNRKARCKFEKGNDVKEIVICQNLSVIIMSTKQSTTEMNTRIHKWKRHEKQDWKTENTVKNNNYI